MKNEISKKTFNYLGLDFTPLRFFTSQDREAYITLNKVRCYKNKNLDKWNYTEFYKLAIILIWLRSRKRLSLLNGKNNDH